ncbi:unnamed protein product [Diatraea saccharalis]|uniref:UDENN domain-containing protein n=1 Tax=Diatraea saccharalis TaxID=40085 RepID=A0A9P0G1Q1_9NEOP|nr:unnamed protein product [Diatraea saccharalis]
MGSRVRDTVRYLFELFCEVSPGDHTKEPFIIRKYPEIYKNEEELKNIPKFTFPCQIENSFVQHYSFVLTSVDSKYTFCFCRFDPKANTALVLLSHLPWHDIFYKLLNCIAVLLNSTEKGELISFLEACRIRPPMPGHTLKVTYNAGHSVFSCQSPDTKLPSIPENCNLTEYFSALDAKCMAGLWAALLHERRVAIVASKPSRLSACVQAANATLFPMSWQHIFIPILPKHLVDYLLAPMPFLIGVPRSVMETVRMSEIGDVVIVDVDANDLRTPFHDLESLPPDLVTTLKKSLSDKNALGDAVSRAFLRALVCLIGGYRDAIKIENGQLITFNPEAFVRTRKTMQPFLRKILQSQIFQQFIDERLDLLNSGRGFNDEFEVECNNYADKLNTGSGQKLKQQYRDWAKTVKKEGGAFFKTVKDKVRKGGKNMKSAVKGLKNKIPRTGSRPSSINTTDDSRFSCGSATPVSSDSSDSSPSHDAPTREPPPALPLDLLTEMEFLFAKKHTQRRDSVPNSSHNSDISLPDKSSCGSVSDLIKLDDSPTNLEDFDPLKCRDKNNVDQIKSSTDSALLHEYGLDFSQFGLLDYTPSSSSTRQETSSSVPKGWTTFN